MIICASVLAAGTVSYSINGYTVLLTSGVNLPVTRTPHDVGLHYRDVALTTADGLKISGWHIPAEGEQAVIAVHGIHANRQQALPLARPLVDAGYHMLLIDLRAHGHSEGETVSFGYREAWDVQAGVDYLLGQPGIEQVGVIGFSLGGAAVAHAAAQDERIEAVVIQSSYSSLRDAIRDGFSTFTGLPRWPFAGLVVRAAEQQIGLDVAQINSAEALRTMTPRPVFIIHGESDGLFPVEQAYKLHEAAQSPRVLWVIDDLGHGFPQEKRALYAHRLRQFFDEAFAANPARP